VIDPPNPTVRLEMLRDGLEDYEYFVILKRLLRERGDKLNVRQRRRYEALLEVPDQVSRSLTDFSDNPAALEKHRERLAEAIEDLTND
jgi:succinate dehydrogenase flavin-adding protein (antitoxin of CptAB toxin-antitoxin module)